MEQVLLRSRRRPRPFLLLCAASPLVLCIGWSALWLVARHEAAAVMDGWLADEAGRGRQWTCPGRGFSGFPLQLRLTCEAPTLAGDLGGGILDVALGGIEVTGSLLQPNAVEASLTGPATIHKAGQDAPSTVTWTLMRIQARRLPDDRLRVALTMDAPALDDGGTTGRAAYAELRVGPETSAAPADKAYDVSFKARGASLPGLDGIAGDAALIDIDQRGVVTAVDPRGPAPWPVLVEGWRRAGGVFDLTALTIDKGPFRAEAHGRLGIDDAHRVTGRLQAALRGYEPLAARFGISPGTLAMGNAVLNMLKGTGAPAPTDPTSVKLPLTFADGRFSIGPVRTALRLPSLY